MSGSQMARSFYKGSVSTRLTVVFFNAPDTRVDPVGCRPALLNLDVSSKQASSTPQTRVFRKNSEKFCEQLIVAVLHIWDVVVEAAHAGSICGVESRSASKSKRSTRRTPTSSQTETSSLSVSLSVGSDRVCVLLKCHCPCSAYFCERIHGLITC